VIPEPKPTKLTNRAPRANVTTGLKPSSMDRSQIAVLIKQPPPPASPAGCGGGGGGETGLSKGALLSLVTAKSVINTYRIMNPEATFFPMIWVDKKSAGFGIGFKF